MRSLSSILLAALMLVASVGITVNRHYCGGKLKSISLFSSFDTVSCCGDKEMPADCCEDEREQFRVDDDYQTTSFSLIPLDETVVLLPFLCLVPLSNQSASIPEYLNYKPPLLAVDIGLEVQSFLI